MENILLGLIILLTLFGSSCFGYHHARHRHHKKQATEGFIILTTRNKEKCHGI